MSEQLADNGKRKPAFDGLARVHVANVVKANPIETRVLADSSLWPL